MKLNFKKFKKGLLLGLVFVTIPLVAWFGYNQWSLSKLIGQQSHEMSGVLKSIDGNKLTVFGSHIDDTTPNVADYSNRQDLTVIIESNTKLVKSVWNFPESLDSLIKNKTKLDLAKIEKEKQDGSIDDLKNIKGMPIIVRTKNNSVNDSTVKAEEVEYTIFVYPK